MTIRKTFHIVYGALFVLSVALAALAVLLFINQKSFERSEENRFQSFLLAEELRQTGEELTRFARAYVVTGNERFKQCFQDILAIRHGEKPRPEHYERIYWDFMAAGRKPPRGHTQAVPLLTVMKQAGVTEQEFAKLKEAQTKSDALAKTEDAAMNAREGLYDDGTGHFTRHAAPDVAMATRLTHDQSYHDAITDIRVPIDDFFGMLDARTAAKVADYSQRGRLYLYSILSICGLMIVLKLATFAVVHRRIWNPVEALQRQVQTVATDLNRLTGITNNIAAGELDKRFVVSAQPLRALPKDEIGSLMRKHDEMIACLQETGSAVATLTATQKCTEESLRQARDELERKVQERTAELEQSNEALIAEVTERKNAAQAMRESQRLLRAIIDNSTAIVFVKDAEGRYLLVNQQFEKVFHLNAREVLGKTDYEFFPKEEADALRAFDRQVMESETALEKEETLSLGDGLHTYIAIKSALRDDEEKVSGLCGIATDITARQQAEQALRQSEEQYRVVVETANEAVVSIDETSRILFANSATTKIFGYSNSELAGQLLTRLMPASFRTLHEHAVERYVKTGRRSIDWRGIEVVGRRKAGDEFPIEVSFGEILKDGRRIFTGCIRDITERKKVEAIQTAQARQAGVRADVSSAFASQGDFRSILKECAEAIVRHLGASFARIWTISENENVLQLQASAGLYTHLDGSHARVPVGQLKIGRIAREGKPHMTNDVPNDERVSDRDWAKREGMIAFAGYPLLVEGRVTGVLAMFARKPLEQSVLETLESVAEIVAQGIYRKDAEDKLRQREHSLRLLTETIPQMIWSASPDGAIDYCNRQILDFTGKQREQLRGDGWAAVIHPDELPSMQRSWREAVENQLPYEVEFRHRRADGVFRWCLSRALPLRDDQGHVVRWYGCITDLDDWRRAQETARKSQAELAHVTRVMTMGELTSSIAHEINQPLGAIANYGNACLRLLTNAPENLDDIKHALSKIVSDANRASAVIAHIRALSKKSPAEKVPLNLKELIGEVLTLARTELNARRVSVHTELADNTPAVSGDRVQIQQVMLNLIMNSIEAMCDVDEQNRTLQICGCSHEFEGQTAALISVRDSGIGLKSEGMDRLFEAFYTTKSNGLGMGLAISRSIVEAHGGKLWAEPNEGPGATFSVLLPSEVRSER